MGAIAQAIIAKLCMSFDLLRKSRDTHQKKTEIIEEKREDNKTDKNNMR